MRSEKQRASGPAGMSLEWSKRNDEKEESCLSVLQFLALHMPWLFSLVCTQPSPCISFHQHLICGKDYASLLSCPFLHGTNINHGSTKHTKSKEKQGISYYILGNVGRPKAVTEVFLKVQLYLPEQHISNMS